LWVGGDEKFVLSVSELGSPPLNCSNAVASLAKAPTVLDELHRQLSSGVLNKGNALH
jgi:hypothetical protein